MVLWNGHDCKLFSANLASWQRNCMVHMHDNFEMFWQHWALGGRRQKSRSRADTYTTPDPFASRMNEKAVCNHSHSCKSPPSFISPPLTPPRPPTEMLYQCQKHTTTDKPRERGEEREERTWQAGRKKVTTMRHAPRRHSCFLHVNKSREIFHHGNFTIALFYLLPYDL